VAKEIFDTEIKLFSIISYNIFTAFYNVFRFVNCIHLMRSNCECEIVIPYSQEDKGLEEISWPGVNDNFYNDDGVFKVTTDYFTDTTNLKIKKIAYIPEIETTAKSKKKNIKLFIRSSAKKLYDVYYKLTNYRGKCKKYVLNMADDNLWIQVLNAINTIDMDERIGIVSTNAVIYKDGVVANNICKPENIKIKLSRAEHQEDIFLPFFRCKEFIQNWLIHKYEQILSESEPRCRALKELFSKGRVCAVVGTACGAKFIDALTSQLARGENIPVIGMQHGGHYGYMDFFDKLGYSDYYSCDYWFSWGFDRTYLESVFPSTGSPLAEIIPIGSVEICHLKNSRRKIRKQKVQIIYPMVNNMRLVESTFRTDDFKLYSIQKKILERLFASRVEILLKPHEGFAVALDDMLKNTPENVSVTSEPLNKIYKKYDFEWIIIDFLSTPFEEVCVSESQILVFNDSTIWPIEPAARTLMEKRAWLFDDEQRFLGMLDRILAGEIFNKRLDKSFEKNFILPYGENTIQKTREELFRIILNGRHGDDLSRRVRVKEKGCYVASV
jgi:hypothetical protein